MAKAQALPPKAGASKAAPPKAVTPKKKMTRSQLKKHQKAVQAQQAALKEKQKQQQAAAALAAKKKAAKLKRKTPKKRNTAITATFAIAIIVCVLFLVATFMNPLATISFDSCGGSHADSILVWKGDSIKMPPNPVKDGYDFDAWY
ncbi:MAG: InlB B-repeat-containing protein, partial [Clostridiales bacterium]|nr:InlB B-repeat-containing protein [Clostridiales bacterium]